MNADTPVQADLVRWLLLIHQLPNKPAYLRVKVWRRLQALGAVGVKNTVYAMPAGEQAQEDLEWLLKEIAEGGGEGMICEARLIDGLSDDDVRALFNGAREADYDEVVKEARELQAALGRKNTELTPAEARSKVARLRTDTARIVAIDFFGANGREKVEGLLSGLEERLREEQDMAEKEPVQKIKPSPIEALKGKTWVTRKGVYVDRIASAWLIRRFIDPDARFKFVAAKGYAPKPGELRFDMFEGEFTHEGDRCTFEVLVSRAGLNDVALAAIAEIVHDIDLKDAKFGREEASGIARVMDGVAAANKDDNARLERGASVLDDLYQVFRSKRR